jgi:hypothetical protein
MRYIIKDGEFLGQLSVIYTSQEGLCSMELDYYIKTIQIVTILFMNISYSCTTNDTISWVHNLHNVSIYQMYLTIPILEKILKGDDETHYIWHKTDFCGLQFNELYNNSEVKSQKILSIFLVLPPHRILDMTAQGRHHFQTKNHFVRCYKTIVFIMVKHISKTFL